MANQIIIDIGAVANDGTGDPLRTAFGYVNNNFSNVWASGVTTSNIAFDGNRILTTNTNGNLVLAPNGIGKVQSNVDIVPSANNALSLGSLTRQWNTVYTQNLAVDGNVSVGDLTVDGNLTVNGTTTTINTANVDIEDKMITLAFGSSTANLANGAGINVAGANANITYLSVGNKWQLNKNTDVVGNLAVSSGSLTITGPLGNVWRLDGDKIISPAGGSWESIANTEYFSSGIDGFVHINSFDANGNIASTVDVEHSFITFNIYNGIDAQWSMNSNGTTAFPNYTFPYVDGNVNEILATNGNGTLTWSTAYGNANVAAYLPTYSGNISAAYINVANVVNVQNDVFAKRGTFTGDPVTGDASMYVGSPTFTNLGTDVMAQFTGNVPNYAQLNLQNYGNSNTASGDYIITADNGTDSTHFLNLGLTGSNWDGSQPNSLGNRLGANDGYLYVQDGDMVIGTSNGTIETWKFDQTGNLTVPGDIVPAGNNTQSLGSATNQWADLWVSNATIYMNSVPVTLGAGNVLTVNGEALLSNDSNTSISTTGNITADYFFGNGSQLTGLPASYTDANVTTLLSNLGSNTIDGTGNITTTANISGNYILGNATFMTGIPASYGNANVADFLDSFGTNSISTTGNVTATNFIGNISITGNVTGTSPNVTLVAGSYSYTFDNTGILTLPAPSTGLEGGEIDFTQAANSTLSGNTVVVDQYADRLRFFESGGNTRGVYIDLAKAPAGVSGELQFKASGLVNRGVDVTLDNLKARIPAAGNVSLQLSTVTGTYSVFGSDTRVENSVSSTTITGQTPVSITTTPAYLDANINFATAGATDTWVIMDTANAISWRISLIVGTDYNNNMITIERLV